MKTSQRGLNDIIQHEGERLKAYQDWLPGVGHYDVPTIGVGHTTAAGPPFVHMGMTITHMQSREILAADLARVEERVEKAFGERILPQTVFDGAVSFDFNTGGIFRASWVLLWKLGYSVAAEQHFLL